MMKTEVCDFERFQPKLEKIDLHMPSAGFEESLAFSLPRTQPFARTERSLDVIAMQCFNKSVFSRDGRFIYKSEDCPV